MTFQPVPSPTKPAYKLCKHCNYDVFKIQVMDNGIKLTCEICRKDDYIDRRGL